MKKNAPQGGHENLYRPIRVWAVVLGNRSIPVMIQSMPIWNRAMARAEADKLNKAKKTGARWFVIRLLLTPPGVHI